MASEAGSSSGLLNQSTKLTSIGTQTRFAILCVAVIASLGLLYWQVPNTALLIAFGAMVLCTAAAVYFIRPQTGLEDEAVTESADWVVTRLIADQSDIGLAVTDRAGRLRLRQ